MDDTHTRHQRQRHCQSVTTGARRTTSSIDLRVLVGCLALLEMPHLSSFIFLDTRSSWVLDSCHAAYQHSISALTFCFAPNKLI